MDIIYSNCSIFTRKEIFFILGLSVACTNTFLHFFKVIFLKLMGSGFLTMQMDKLHIRDKIWDSNQVQKIT